MTTSKWDAVIKEVKKNPRKGKRWIQIATREAKKEKPQDKAYMKTLRQAARWIEDAIKAKEKKSEKEEM
jgi:hypothetical protein